MHHVKCVDDKEVQDVYRFAEQSVHISALVMKEIAAVVQHILVSPIMEEIAGVAQWTSEVVATRETDLEAREEIAGRVVSARKELREWGARVVVEGETWRSGGRPERNVSSLLSGLCGWSFGSFVCGLEHVDVVTPMKSQWNVSSCAER